MSDKKMDKKKPAAKPAGKPLSPRERKAVAGKLAGKSSAAAARAAGYSEPMAHAANAKIFSKPNVQAAFQEWMTQAGISDELLAQRMREGLDAMETKLFQRKTYRTPGEDHSFGDAPPKLTASGALSRAGQKRETPDDELIARDLIAYGERREMLELIVKIRGLAAPDKIEVSGTLNHVIERLAAARQRLAKGKDADKPATD